jgi:ABC-type phosphate transport system substrate-binding protein
MKNKLLLILCILLYNIPTLYGEEINPTIIFDNNNFSNVLIMNRLAVQRIFTRKDTHWENGDNITVFIKPMDSIEHRAFVTDILNMTLYKYQKSLDTYTYTAKATSVHEVTNDDKMKIAIQTHPGSIGYINYELIMNEKIIKVVD